MLFIAMGMILIGALIWSWILYTIFLGIISLRWPVVEGLIQKSYFETIGTGQGRRQSIYYITYEYKVGGQTYTGNKRRFAESYYSQNYSKDYAQSLVRAHPPGYKVKVHYNPGRPALSVLEPGVHMLRQSWVIVAGIITLAPGIYILLNTLSNN